MYDYFGHGFYTPSAIKDPGKKILPNRGRESLSQFTEMNSATYPFPWWNIKTPANSFLTWEAMWLISTWNGVFLNSLLYTEVKKSRSTGRQQKEAVPEEVNQSVFATFLRGAGVTLKQSGTSNEIGKYHQFGV